MANHSYLGASAMKRRILCNGSYALDKRALVPEDSVCSADGTATHWVAEQCLIDPTMDPIDFIGSVCPENDVFLRESMLDAPTMYVNHVRETLASLGVTTAGGEAEKHIDLSWVDSEMFGTSDYQYYHEATRTLYVWDYKNGFDDVEAVENPQLAFYALDSYKYLFRAVCFIVQPNAGGIKEHIYSRDDLTTWIQTFRDVAKVCRSESARRVPGDSQCKHCSGKAICPENRSEAWTRYEATRDFYAADDIEDEIDAIDAAMSYLKSRKETLDLAAWHLTYNEGQAFQRHKLVRGVTQRKWKDETQVIAWCELNNVDPFERKVLTPAKLSRIIDIEAFTEKPEGKVKLVRNEKRGTPIGNRLTERFKDTTGGVLKGK